MLVDVTSEANVYYAIVSNQEVEKTETMQALRELIHKPLVGR